MRFRPLAIVFYSSMCIYIAKGQYPYSPYYNYYYTNNYPSPVYSTYQIQQDSPDPGPSVDENIECAKLWGSAYYQGRTIDFRSNEKRTDLGGSYFMAQSVKVKPGCSLTTFDDYGKNQLMQKNSHWIGYSRRITASCCECNSCDGESVNNKLQCARLYEHENCNGCTGFRLDLKNGDKAKSFGPLDNRMSSVAIRPGCNLVVYFEKDFMGHRYNFTRSVNLFGDNWHKRISSAECFCPSDPNPSFPSTTPYPIPTTSRYTTPLPTTTKYTTPPSTTTTTTTTTTTPKTTTPQFENDSTEEPEVTPDYGTIEGPWDEDKTSNEDATNGNDNSDDGFFNSDEDEDKVEVTEAPTTTTSTTIMTTKLTTTTEQIIESQEEDDGWSDSEEDTEEEDTEYPTTTTSTTPKPLTTTSTPKPITTTTSTTSKPKTTTTEEPEEDDDWWS